MIITKITGKLFENGILKVNVAYEGDAGSFTETYQVRNARDLESSIRNRVNQLTETVGFVGILTDGEYILPTPPSLTQAEIEQRQFIQDLNKWKSVKNAIDVGILTGNESQVVALLEKVKSEFKPTYLNII